MATRSIRVRVTDAEWRAIRRLAIDDDSTLEEYIGEALRQSVLTGEAMRHARKGLVAQPTKERNK